MLDTQSQSELKREIIQCIEGDQTLLDQLRQEISPLKNQIRRIQPRTTTSISLVATDGGNNKLQFDPFLVQIVRVVDSSNNELCLDAITPTTKISYLNAKQFNTDGTPKTDLGKMMAYLGITKLNDLSTMIQGDEAKRPRSPSWVQVYRELVEWAVLFEIVRNKDFGTDTLIVFDGLLRSKVFAQDLFKKLLQGFREAIEQHWKKRRRIYLTGVAKHSQVYTRYRLAMALEGILTTDYPAYLEIPRDIEEKAYRWAEFARGDDREQGGEINKFVGGKMFFVKFGSKP